MKTKLLLLILILFIICILFMIKTDFVETFFKLGKVSSFIEKTKTNPKVGEKAVNSIEGKATTAEGEEWMLEYGVPTCYKDDSPYPLKQIRSARIYWQQLKPDESVRGTYTEKDATLVYTGTFDGKNLKLTDSKFPGGAAKISGSFLENYSVFEGTYEVDGDMGLKGCEGLDGIIAGVTGKPVDE